MLQDIYPNRLFNQYDPEVTPGPDDYVLIFRKSSVVAKIDETLSFPKLKDLDKDTQLTYLFSIDDERFFLLETDEPEAALKEGSGFSLLDIKEIREDSTPPKYRIFAACTGKHLADWYRDNKYCGCCGSKMEHSSTERAMVCTSCKHTVYPRIMPAVIVGVINGEKILLTKYRRGFNHNALIAGFTEIGETLEETVEREVMEEAGLKVKNIRYYKSQPWGIANDILAGYYCDVDGDDTIHMDDNELKSASWTAREDIVLQPDESSLTNEMMKNFKEGIPV